MSDFRFSSNPKVPPLVDGVLALEFTQADETTLAELHKMALAVELTHRADEPAPVLDSLTFTGHGRDEPIPAPESGDLLIRAVHHGDVRFFRFRPDGDITIYTFQRYRPAPDPIDSPFGDFTG